MAEPRQFDREYIDGQLDYLASKTARPLDVYLIGGCAMSLRNLKQSTHDIDIVLKNEADYDVFCSALEEAGYVKEHTVINEYEGLRARGLYRNKDGFHPDLFVEHILKKLRLSETMTRRAELYKQYTHLGVYLVSKEDIFIFKGFASESRTRDLPDMRAVYPGLDWDAMLKEVRSQKLSAGLVALLARRLERFSEEYRLDVPILKELK